MNPSVFANASRVLSEIDVDWKRAVIQDSDNEQLSNLHEALRPFLLRRKKEDTNVHIPPKCELVLYVRMTPMQRHYYKLSLARNIQAISSSSSSSSGGGGGLNNVMCNLRKCCNHPYLFDGAEPKFDGELSNNNSNKQKDLTPTTGDWKIGDHIWTNSAKVNIGCFVFLCH